MKTEHTPGPWRIGDAGNTVFGSPNGEPAPVVVATLAPARGAKRANARMVAAAPDLLEACKEAVSGLGLDARENADELEQDFGTEGVRVFNLLRAAIAKAEGQEARRIRGTAVICPKGCTAHGEDR